MRVLYCSCLILALLGTVSAQSVIYGPGSTRAFQTAYSGPQTIVRDSKANLYVIYRYQVSTQWDLAIARSSDNGSSWNMTWQTSFAQLGTDFGSYHPCIAIDSQDNLHCAWLHRVAFTGSRLPQTIHYNRFEAATSKWGTEWVVTPSAVYERPNPVLTVDQNDYVWFSHGNTGWDSVIKRSDKPFASDGKFTSFSPVFSASNSQHMGLVVDALNRIHISYYDTGGGYAGVKHQWIDPGASSPKWTLTSLSNHGPTNHTARAEYNSRMAADIAGNVYAIYNVDDQAPSSGRTGNTETYIRKWDGSTQGWGQPVLVQSVPSTVWAPSSGANDGRFITCGCDEASGEFYFTYRDFTTGDFVLGRWRGIDTEQPTAYARLMNTSPLPPNSRNYFFLPHMRGSLWPRQNRTGYGIDLTYVAGDQTASTPVYTDYFEHFPLGSMTSTATPKVGTTYPVALSATTEGGKAYATALTMSGLMPLAQLGRRFVPVAPDALFFLTVGNALPGVFQDFHGVLGASGTGQAKVAIPNIPVLVGLQMDGCFITYDLGGAGAISNAWGFMITN